MSALPNDLQRRMSAERAAYQAAVLADDMRTAAKHQKRYRHLEAERRRRLLEQARERGAA